MTTPMTRATVRRDAAPPPAPPEPSPILLHAGVGSPGPRYSSAARLTPWLVGAVVLVVGLSIIDTLPVGALLDDGMYVILAKSLATGHGFRWLNVPGMPPATHFPPGYPALLALVWLLVPSFP